MSNQLLQKLIDKRDELEQIKFQRSDNTWLNGYSTGKLAWKNWLDDLIGNELRSTLIWDFKKVTIKDVQDIKDSANLERAFFNLIINLTGLAPHEGGAPALAQEFLTEWAKFCEGMEGVDMSGWFDRIKELR